METGSIDKIQVLKEKQSFQLVPSIHSVLAQGSKTHQIKKQVCETQQNLWIGLWIPNAGSVFTNR